MNHLFANITRYTDLLPIILFLLFLFKGRMNSSLWVIFLYCVFVALNDNLLFKYVPDEYSKYIFSAFTLLELLTFTYYLWQNATGKAFKKLLVIVSILFTLFIIIYFLSVNFNVIDSVPIGVETIVVIAFSIYFLYEQVNKNVMFIYETPEFWVITGFLLYLAGSFFIYIYASHVPYEELKQFWFLTFIFGILKNIFISVAILVQAKTSQQVQAPKEYQPYLN